MITDLLLEFFASMLSGFLSLTPEISFDPRSLTEIAGAIEGIGAINGYFPVTTLAACILAVVGVRVIMLAYRLVLFIYHQFWGSS